MSWWSNMRDSFSGFFRNPDADRLRARSKEVDRAMQEFDAARRELRDQTARLYRSSRAARREKDAIAALVEGIRRGME